MIEYMENLLKAMRPAFSRQKTFIWFVIVFVGFVMRAFYISFILPHGGEICCLSAGGYG